MTRVRVRRSDDLCYFRVSNLESVINTTQTSSQSSEQSEINAFQGNDVLPPLTQCHDTRDRAWSRDAPLTRDNHPHPPQRDNSRVMNCVKASTKSVWLHITKIYQCLWFKKFAEKNKYFGCFALFQQSNLPPVSSQSASSLLSSSPLTLTLYSLGLRTFC